jgi:hypothetical protein
MVVVRLLPFNISIYSYGTIFDSYHREITLLLERAHSVLHRLALDQRFSRLDQGTLGVRHSRRPGRGATWVPNGLIVD